MADLLSSKSSDVRVDSDDASSKKPVKRSRRVESDDENKRLKKSRITKLTSDETEELETILDQLQTTSLSELSPSQQILLLYSLYRAVRSLECVKEEQERRLASLNSLILEESSIQSQLQELQNVYVPQEQTLREAFIQVIQERQTTRKQRRFMLSKRYQPSDKSKYPEERDLAAFLSKKQNVFDDMKKRLEELRIQLLEVNKQTCDVGCLGHDRNDCEYFFFPEDMPPRIWIHDKRQKKWSYLWNIDQLQSLMNWLDNRGSKEQILYSALRLYFPIIKRLLEGTQRVAIDLMKGELYGRKQKNAEPSHLVIDEDENKIKTLFQTHGEMICVPQWKEGVDDCVSIKGRISPSLCDISSCLFIPLFLKPVYNQEDLTHFHEVLFNVYDYNTVTLDQYKTAVLTLESTIMKTIQFTYIHPDWVLARLIWRHQVEQAMNFSDVSYYLRDIEASCIDFAIVDALTTTTGRREFIEELEKKTKKHPVIPDEGETVVYYSVGHALSIRDFKQHNVFSGVVNLDEKEQCGDYVCRVQSVQYFPGRGNAFVRLVLKPVANTVISVLVNSYYQSLSSPNISVTYPETYPESPSVDPFEVTMWMNNTESDFVITLSKYFMAFANNLHIGDSFKMYFQGIESQVTNTSKKRKRDARLEGSYLYGHVVSIAPLESQFFPWDALTVEWDSGGNEAGTNHINPWECEFIAKDMSLRSERSRELGATRTSARGDNRRLTDEELKVIRVKAMEVVKTHTKQDGEDFYHFLENYWGKQGMEVTRPVLSYEPLDLGLLWKLMQVYGGYECVVNTKGSWLDIYRMLPTYRSQNTSAPTSLHKIYLKYMWQFEKEQREEKGLPPIIDPRLPLPTTPGKLGSSKTGGKTAEAEYRDSEVKKKVLPVDLALFDAPPGVQMMEKIIREEERKKNVLTMKWKTMHSTLQFIPGTISTVNGVESDNAYQGIVNGSICTIKRKIETMTKFVSNLKQIMSFYV